MILNYSHIFCSKDIIIKDTSNDIHCLQYVKVRTISEYEVYDLTNKKNIYIKIDNRLQSLLGSLTSIDKRKSIFLRRGIYAVSYNIKDDKVIQINPISISLKASLYFYRQFLFMYILCCFNEFMILSQMQNSY